MIDDFFDDDIDFFEQDNQTVETKNLLHLQSLKKNPERKILKSEDYVAIVNRTTQLALTDARKKGQQQQPENEGKDAPSSSSSSDHSSWEKFEDPEQKRDTEK
ncbi:hypothetical protein Pmani_026044 [Petrolisthes manimaculis]|nr:hypothetical protein Pmani_026044 [Petrolisthes manimaculis]